MTLEVLVQKCLLYIADRWCNNWDLLGVVI